MSSISEGLLELALPRRKSPAGWTLPPRRRSGVLRSGRGRSPRGSATGSRAGQKSFRPGACFFLHRKPNGVSARNLLVAQANLATTYKALGQLDEAEPLLREVHFGYLRLNGLEHENTLQTANNYASLLFDLNRFEEAKTLLRKAMPVARRFLGDSHQDTLRIRWTYAAVIALDATQGIDDLREAVTTLEDTERIARRVLGGTNPLTEGIESCLRNARAALKARQE